MSKIAVLKAIGPNSVVVIPMVFANIGEGEKFMDQIFANYEGQSFRWRTGWDKEKRQAIYQDGPAVKKSNEEKDGLARIGYNVHDSLMENDSPIFDRIFTSYYDGCGGVSYIVLEEVEFGVPLCGFSLD